MTRATRRPRSVLSGGRGRGWEHYSNLLSIGPAPSRNTRQKEVEAKRRRCLWLAKHFPINWFPLDDDLLVGVASLDRNLMGRFNDVLSGTGKENKARGVQLLSNRQGQGPQKQKLCSCEIQKGNLNLCTQ